jgi:multisubunit Na+/H+ antiporter MnhE subunit
MPLVLRQLMNVQLIISLSFFYVTFQKTKKAKKFLLSLIFPVCVCECVVRLLKQNKNIEKMMCVACTYVDCGVHVLLFLLYHNFVEVWVY